ncbi:MAG TPA: hypothetical protein VJQ56_06790 [Blastocatellia bacterium]|nr:hypothetical protein [Blastocatellia bacterium]
MAEHSDYSSIGPLNQTAQKEATEMLGYIVLDFVATIAVVYIAGAIINSLT